MADPPIVCTLTREALTARREGLFSKLQQQVQQCDLLPEGLRLTFPATAEALSTITRVVDAERQCCRFLRFQIVVEPDGGPIVLELTGPPGTREFVEGLLDE